MSDHITQTIAVLEERLRSKLEEVEAVKNMINELAKLAGQPLPHAEATRAAAPGIASLRADHFYGRPLATVVREYLELRKASGLGPASVNEIHEALLKGGYAFDTSNDAIAKRGLRVSLSKNSSVFHRLPQGEWGLVEWYPAVKARADRNTKNGNSSEPNEAARDDEGSDAEVAAKRK